MRKGLWYPTETLCYPEPGVATPRQGRTLCYLKLDRGDPLRGRETDAVPFAGCAAEFVVWGLSLAVCMLATDMHVSVGMCAGVFVDAFTVTRGTGVVLALCCLLLLVLIRKHPERCKKIFASFLGTDIHPTRSSSIKNTTGY